MVIDIFSYNQGEPVHRQTLVTAMGGRNLILAALHRSDTGLYTCMASNTVGDGHSNAVLLTVLGQLWTDGTWSIGSPRGWCEDRKRELSINVSITETGTRILQQE